MKKFLKKDGKSNQVIKMADIKKQEGLEFDTEEICRDFWSNLRIENRKTFGWLK